MKLTYLTVFFSYVYISLLTLIGERSKIIDILGFKVSLMFICTFCWFIYLLVTLVFLKRLRILKENKYIFLSFNIILLMAYLGIAKQDFYNLSFKLPPLMYCFMIANAGFLLYIHLEISKMDKKKYLYLMSILILISQGALKIYVGDNGRFASLLGGAAVVHLIFLLIAALFLSNYIQKKGKIDLIFMFISIYFLLSTQSRTGLVVLILLIITIFILSSIKVRNKIILSVIFIVGFSLIIQFVSTERYKNFESDARSQSFETSKQIFLNGDNKLFGVGWGEVWPWYNYEIYGASFSYDVYTIYGYTLSNPHSVYYGLLVELGIIPLFLFSLIFLILLKTTITNRKKDKNSIEIVLMSLIISFVVFSQDYYLFKNFSISYIWWVFLFLSLSIVNDERNRDV